MTPEKLKKATLFAIKRPHVDPKPEPPEDEFRYTVRITGEEEMPLTYVELFLRGHWVFGKPHEIDWGDGNTTNVPNSTSNYYEHQYAQTGTYTIRIRVAISYLSLYYVRSHQRLPAYSLVSIDSPISAYAEEPVDYEILFTGNKNLVQIAGGVFSKCPALTTVYSCFAECSRLQMISEDLFQGCRQITNFGSAFSRCSLRSIPGKLFWDSINAVSFSLCFSGNPIRRIPGELFLHNPAATGFGGCFSGCKELEEIPPGLFENNEEAKSFASCFSECTGLSSIPADIFENCLGITNLSSTFSGCTGITGNVPRLWETHPNASHAWCFRDCVNAANYADIPADWK